MNIDNAAIRRIVESQGWNESSLLDLLLRYLDNEEQSVQDELLEFLQEVADAENGVVEDEGAEAQVCAVCREAAFATSDGRTYHGEPGYIDYNRDSEHAALPIPDEDDEDDDEDEDEDEESLWCAECGEECFLTPEGVAHHGLVDEIDHARDANHTAVPDVG